MKHEVIVFTAYIIFFILFVRGKISSIFLDTIPPHGCSQFIEREREKSKTTLDEDLKLVGLADWLECWLSHLRVAGLSPGCDNL